MIMEYIPFFLLAAGLYGLTRRNALKVLLSAEMISLGTLLLAAGSLYQPLALFLLGASAIEAMVGFTVLLWMYRIYETIDLDVIRGLRG